MTTLIEDSARNTVPSWMIEAYRRGSARGAVLSPWTSPRERIASGYKVATRDYVKALHDENAEVWFDPVTHALQMPNVGDFRYYDGWGFWASARGMLGTEAQIRDHIERVFAVQDELGVPHLAPTVLLHAPQSITSQVAVTIATIAVEVDPECRLAIAGDGGFWSTGQALDSHIGALAQLEPSGWWMTVVRNIAVLPVQAMDEEIHGLCRTTRALSDDGPVHISHGDLAALPAAAAGASTIGTGWDTRQRFCCYGSYEPRDDTKDIQGSWYKQVTFEGLLSPLLASEAEVLFQQDSALATRLLTGAMSPTQQWKYLHHVGVLAQQVSRLHAGTPDQAFRALDTTYDSARKEWTKVSTALSTRSRADAWLQAPQNGLRLYAKTEGF